MTAKSKTLALYGVMSALIFVVLLLETYIFIFFIKPSPAFLSIPLAISLCIWLDWKKMFMGGAILGVCSFILSFIVGYTTFFNPLISVLPRVFIGIAAYGVMKLMHACFKNSHNRFLKETLPLSIAGGVGVLTNTVLVLLAMSVFTGDPFVDTAIGVILGLNFVLEFVSAIILVPMLVSAIKHVAAPFGINTLNSTDADAEL